MDYNKVKDQFGTWGNVFKEFIESEQFDAIFSYLKTESQLKKKIIIPASKDLFKSFFLCNRDKMKAVIVLMDPYPTFKKVGKEEVMIASGIPMSCENTGMPQPSLSMWYNALTDVYGFDPDMEQRMNLSYLLEEEHVMMINSSLSVEKDKVGSHTAAWVPFMNNFFKILNEYHRGLPIVLMGTAAQKYEKEINPLLHYIIKCEHPAAAAHQNREWKHENMFQQVNNILKNNNGPEYQINWKRGRVWQDTSKPGAKWDETKINPEAISDMPF